MPCAAKLVQEGAREVMSRDTVVELAPRFSRSQREGVASYPQSCSGLPRMTACQTSCTLCFAMEVTFPAYCDYIRDNMDSLKLAALETFKQMLRRVTAEEVIAKATRGRKTYGGPFDVEAIAAMEELRLEVTDTLAYQAIFDLQKDK